MGVKDPSNKVISLTHRRDQKNGTSGIGKKNRRNHHARVIAITSGKGGVGKTSIVANLGYAFTKLGKQVLILDD